MKILFVRLSSLGDIVLTEPIVKKISDTYPHAEIDFLVKPVFRDVVQAFPKKVNILEWTDNLDSLIKISRKHYDLLIDLHNKPNTALIRFCAQASQKVVYCKMRKLRKQIVQNKTEKCINSTLDLYNSALTKVGISPANSFPVLLPNDSLKPLINDHDLNWGNYILIFPGATSFTKRWLPQYFAKLIDDLSARYQIVVGGSDFSLAHQLRNYSHSKYLDLTGKTNIRELISLVSGSQAIVANDSGPAHIAAAIGKPQITIFGGTSPKLGFAPLNNKGIVLTKNLACSPCSLHGRNFCPLGHFRCMKDISVELVLNQLFSLLDN